MYTGQNLLENLILDSEDSLQSAHPRHEVLNVPGQPVHSDLQVVVEDSLHGGGNCSAACPRPEVQ